MPQFVTEHPSGRELTAFADEVRQVLESVSEELASEAKRNFGLTAQYLDELADRAFAAEARAALANEWLMSHTYDVTDTCACQPYGSAAEDPVLLERLKESTAHPERLVRHRLSEAPQPDEPDGPVPEEVTTIMDERLQWLLNVAGREWGARAVAKAAARVARHA